MVWLHFKSFSGSLMKITNLLMIQSCFQLIPHFCFGWIYLIEIGVWSAFFYSIQFTQNILHLRLFDHMHLYLSLITSFPILLSFQFLGFLLLLKKVTSSFRFYQDLGLKFNLENLFCCFENLMKMNGSPW